MGKEPDVRNRALDRAQLLAPCVEKGAPGHLDEHSRAMLEARLIVVPVAVEVLQLAKQRGHGRGAARQDRTEPETSHYDRGSPTRNTFRIRGQFADENSALYTDAATVGPKVEIGTSGWAMRIKDWERDLARIYLYFKNDQAGFATKNAQQLQALVANRTGSNS